MTIAFKEQQKFTQWWLWLLILILILLPVIEEVQPLLTKNSITQEPFSLSGIISYYVFVLAVIGMFLLMRLKTEIDQDKIQFSFVPFIKKQIKWNDIKTAQIVNYGFVGGWGIRFRTKYGTIYNIKGNKGLAIELHNGKKLVIGTQREIELRKIVDKVLTTTN
ncbi:hypothetical protein [Flavobacterium sp.]